MFLRKIKLARLKEVVASISISLEGSTIRLDNDANGRIYARKIPAKEIALWGTIAIPEAAQQLISTLNAKTPKHKP